MKRPARTTFRRLTSGNECAGTATSILLLPVIRKPDPDGGKMVWCLMDTTVDADLAWMSGPPIAAWTSDTVRELIALTRERLLPNGAAGELVEMRAPRGTNEGRVLVSRGDHGLAVMFSQKTAFPTRLASWLRAMEAAGPLPMDVVERGRLQ